MDDSEIRDGYNIHTAQWVKMSKLPVTSRVPQTDGFNLITKSDSDIIAQTKNPPEHVGTAFHRFYFSRLVHHASSD